VPLATPTVISYDESVYVCAPGDTYAGISRKFYSSAAYAAALQLYNRNHWQASKRMKQDGELVPGEQLFVPPIRVLEEKHGNKIPTAAPTGEARASGL
jgi:hypothetical protein